MGPPRLDFGRTHAELQMQLPACLSCRPAGREKNAVHHGCKQQPVQPCPPFMPIEELVGDERPAMYKKLRAKTFGDGFWDAFALGERTIDHLKIKVDQPEQQQEMKVA
ncbi:hypothetical protein HU200_015390 [Digitaria exilis]|uniref:Uncharacterized protein n=1 Tax=Digitaria exilis TaxID=1010633 RepID=A0A835KID3_9POAL|nr:hypothetical protein HU200_015390 [Digitaria exilis]